MLGSTDEWAAVANRISGMQERQLHYGYAKVNWKRVREVAGRVYDRIKPYIGEAFPRT